MFNMGREILCPACLIRCMIALVEPSNEPVWVIYEFDNPFSYDLKPRVVQKTNE